MAFLEIKDPGINVEQIMAEIKSQVAEKMKNPAYAADVARFEKEQKIYQAADESTVDLEFLEKNYDIDAPKPIFSHRPLIGNLIITAKNWLYRLVHDVFELTIQNQVIFNFFTAKNQKNLQEQLKNLEKRLEILENLVKNR